MNEDTTKPDEGLLTDPDEAEEETLPGEALLASYDKADKLGRIRLSRNFFMRDFLYS